MRHFESDVQRIRYEVLKHLIQKTKERQLEQSKYTIPKEILPGTQPISRCCVYKERAIIAERVALALDPIKETIIATIESACDECSAQRYAITDSCRGCFAKKCVQACTRGAITKEKGKSIIDYDKCVGCGRCKEVCPFNAIVEVLKPCMRTCKSKAIHIQVDNTVAIDDAKCISCGACVYHCPFGAISDRSEIVPIIEAIETARHGNRHLYAVIAPAIVTQYAATIGQLVAALKKLCFTDVLEVALGADLVAYYEAKEFIDRVVTGQDPCMMSSCCPAFVSYVQKHYPTLTAYTSSLVSPMVAISRFITQIDPSAKIIFIGPCMAKKEEKLHYITTDPQLYVMTFEELEALLDAYEIPINAEEEKPLDNASYFGRLFARSGGVAEAITAVLEESQTSKDTYQPIVCNGLQEVDKAIKLLKAGKNTFNFIEGMACIGGCVGGAACLTHNPLQSKKVETYAKGALEKNITDALRVIDHTHLNLHRPQ